jgi:hypothetical protein
VTGNGATALDGSPGLKHVASKTAAGLTKDIKDTKFTGKGLIRKLKILRRHKEGSSIIDSNTLSLAKKCSAA